MRVAGMEGRTVVLTGGSSGIGLATAGALAALGARVVITARRADRGREALARIRQQSGADRAELVVLDLADLDSVRDGAAEILDRCPRVDVLVNNAGVVLSQRIETAQGFEATFATNHLGPFLLTALLRERLLAAPAARVVTVASAAHRTARRGLDFDDLQARRRYRPMGAYGASKLANILFTAELARQLTGTTVTANCLHPGLVATGYGHDATGLLGLGIRLGRPFMLTPDQGARTSIYLASSPDVDGVTGRYFVRCRVEAPSLAARDAGAARRLWELSEEMVGSG
jgi:NAD(P)-dependent dehydrogenase (short-subunit alcohol dehydrogenase family)